MANGAKMDCKVCVVKGGKIAESYDGLVHLVTAVYDPRFTVAYGALSVSCTQSEFDGLFKETEVILRLESGACLQVHLMGKDQSYARPDDIPGDSFWTYFVSIPKSVIG